MQTYVTQKWRKYHMQTGSSEGVASTKPSFLAQKKPDPSPLENSKEEKLHQVRAASNKMHSVSFVS